MAATVDLKGSARRHRREAIFHWLFFSAALFSIVISVAIVLSVLGKAIEFMTNIELGSLRADGWFPRRGDYGVMTLIVGSLITTVIGMLVAGPIGLLTAIYLSEYAKPRVRRVVKPIIEILAGIPSVVIGFFALTFITGEIIMPLNPDASLFNLLAAGLGIGILITPLVASVSEDAIQAVPNSLREASYGMGARRVSTSVRVIVPAAISGIVAAMILAFSRAIGETMVVAIAAGGAGGAQFTTNPLEPGQTITSAIAALASGSDQVAVASGSGAGQAFNSLYFLGLMLFVITLCLNLLGHVFVRRVRNKY